MGRGDAVNPGFDLIFPLLDSFGAPRGVGSRVATVGFVPPIRRPPFLGFDRASILGDEPWVRFAAFRSTDGARVRFEKVRCRPRAGLPVRIMNLARGHGRISVSSATGASQASPLPA